MNDPITTVTLIEHKRDRITVRAGQQAQRSRINPLRRPPGPVRYLPSRSFLLAAALAMFPEAICLATKASRPIERLLLGRHSGVS
jgi:hypothetical protein